MLNAQKRDWNAVVVTWPARGSPCASLSAQQAPVVQPAWYGGCVAPSSCETTKAGIQFAYHNHHFEFVPVDGQMPYETLLTACDPALVKMEMDLCWATAAGQDPVAWFDKYPGRFPMVHVKGLKRIPPNAAQWKTAPAIETLLPDVTDVGAGVIDWARIFGHAQTAGIQHYFVEHDQPAAPFDSLAASAKYLQALRF